MCPGQVSRSVHVGMSVTLTESNTKRSYKTKQKTKNTKKADWTRAKKMMRDEKVRERRVRVESEIENKVTVAIESLNEED